MIIETWRADEVTWLIALAANVDPDDYEGAELKSVIYHAKASIKKWGDKSQERALRVTQ